MACDARPRRQFRRKLRPSMQLSTYESLESAATELQTRIRRTLYARQAGTLVACDPHGAIYLLLSHELRTDEFADKHPGWIVGVYADSPANGAAAAVPSIEMIVEDLQAVVGALAPVEQRAG